ncbi:AraC family transcriptional regulator [Streptomyces griseocarneus]|nr:AraC family transcriptional regulator [Streptomyces griseocarneus]
MSDCRRKSAGRDGKNDGVLDFDSCYRAMASRDTRFDGAFVVAVTSTGVYCRPVCGARTPKPANCRFFKVPAAAEAAGFRACRRCRPETAPSSPEWNVRGDLVARALRLIAGGTVDELGVAGLARQLAVSARHLHRQLVAEVGVGPLALALNRRAHVARMLIESSTLPLSDVAFAAGYSSIRQFNGAILAAFGRAPRELRRAHAAHDTAGSGPLLLHLRFRPPLDGEALLAWLRARAVPGVERVDGHRYHRTLRLPRGSGFAELDLAPATARSGPAVGRHRQVPVRLTLEDLRDVTAAVRRCRDLCDLDADPAAVAETLGASPALRARADAAPGLRVPGCADAFELAVRTVLEQHHPPERAARLCGRLVARWGERAVAPDGEPDRLFPTARALADADPGALGLGTRQAAAVHSLARAVADGALALGQDADRETTVAALRALPGLAPWAVARIATHALLDPDVFSAEDPALRRAAQELGLPRDPHALAREAHAWRPWRSYAAMHLLTATPPA